MPPSSPAEPRSDLDDISADRWNKIGKDLQELESLYANRYKNKREENFEFQLLIKAKEAGIDLEVYRRMFREYYTDKRLLKSFDNWLEETSFFSLLQRFTTLVGVATLLIGAVTFLPTQQAQQRTESARKKIEQDRANYEAWGIINSNRVDSNGNLVQASSGRVIALQNLNKNRVSLQGLEVPEAFLLDIDLSGANLYRSNFQGSDLYRANFSSKPARTNPWICIVAAWTHLVECQTGEELKEWKTDLQRANFRGSILYGAKFNGDRKAGENDSVRSVSLFRADFSPFYRGKGNESRRFDMASDVTTECFAEKPSIQCTRAVGAEFVAADLRSADFTKADLKGANFEGANLECASFRGAIFNSVSDKDPSLPNGLPPTRFAGANIRGADFRDLAAPTTGDKKRGLSAHQIRMARNWDQALYSPSLLSELGLSEQSRQQHRCPAFDRQAAK
jgi:uncharacterized protein YjbI with pentapeptide repeats